MNGFNEVAQGIWYEEATGLPWTSKYLKSLGYGGGFIQCFDGELKRILNTDQDGYYIVKLNRKNRKWHRVVYEKFVSKIPKGEVVDHINNIVSDNRISNLQTISVKENVRKRRKSKVNTSGYTGVRQSISGRWYSIIRNGYKKVYLGTFDTPEEAYAVYLEAKKKYHGEDSLKPLL